MENQDIRKAGLKVTLPRVKILEILESSDARHMTAEDVYKALKPLSRNQGAVDYRALVHGGACFPQKAPDAAFDLIRIGDAVASRNIHAAIYDGLRFTLRI